MPDQEDIAQQQELLATYRRRLAHSLRQQALLGVNTPFNLTEEIREARDEIRRIKEILRGWGVPVEDHPDDEEPSQGRYALALVAASAKVGTGLEALIELMQISEVRAAVAIYQANFEVACRQIEILNAYKMLHDLLQQLEDRHAILMRLSKTVASDNSIWDDAEANESDLYEIVGELLNFASRTQFATETALWTTKLGRAQRDLRTALEEMNASRLKDALRRMREVIDDQLSRIDTRLVDVAKALQLATLVAALHRICDHIMYTGLDKDMPQQLRELRQGVDVLARLEEQLKGAVELHTTFQQLDDELRRVERLLEYDIGELVETWQDFGPIMRTLCSGNTLEWAIRLNELGDTIEGLLTGADQRQLRRAFVRYRSHATVCFNRIDYDLLGLCAALQQVGAPLDRVLRMVQ